MDPSKSQNQPGEGWNTSEKSQPNAPPPYQEHSGYPSPGSYPNTSVYQQYGPPVGPYGQGPYPGQPGGPYPGQPGGPYPGQPAGPYPGQPGGPYPGQPGGPYSGQPGGPYPGQPGGPYSGQSGGPYSGQPVTLQPTVYVTSTPLTSPLPDYLGYSIFTMLCCCLPLGIAALVYSISTRNANMSGQQLIAESSSKMARTLNHVALGIGLTVIVLYIIACIVLTVS